MEVVISLNDAQLAGIALFLCGAIFGACISSLIQLLKK